MKSRIPWQAGSGVKLTFVRIIKLARRGRSALPVSLALGALTLAAPTSIRRKSQRDHRVVMDEPTSLDAQSPGANRHCSRSCKLFQRQGRPNQPHSILLNDSRFW